MRLEEKAFNGQEVGRKGKAKRLSGCEVGSVW